MNRRKFLTITGVAAAAISIPVISFVSTSTREATAGIIQNELHFLKLDKEGLEKFVDDFLTKFPPDTNFKARVRGANLLGVKASNARLGPLLSQQYLLSTDFFRNNMDESKVVKYLAYFNPYQTPCANPFAANFYPSHAS